MLLKLLSFIFYAPAGRVRVQGRRWLSLLEGNRRNLGRVGRDLGFRAGSAPG